ncbi:MAG TPA: hypothetical protein VM513_17185 [Kofleriaceae bacterium]|jgi:hypothetical protein|nr:hypothetical protein [Kofleriaceae bacterium]
MRVIIALWIALVPMVATAQPGSAGSAAPAAGSSDAPQAVMPQVPEPAAPPPSAAPSAADLRKTCADAMNADPTFADAIVVATLRDRQWSWERISAVDPSGASALLALKVNADTLRQHEQAANAIAKNEKHVVLAYAAFWVLAALFVVFLWRRQQGLKAEIAQLKRDLDAASK